MTVGRYRFAGEGPAAHRRRRPGERVWLLMACLAALLAWFTARPARVQADSAVTREYQLKAAFLTKFIQFVKWPSNAMGANDPLVIGIVDDGSGRDPFEGALERLADGKSVNGRTVQVRHFAPDARSFNCQVLFIPGSQDGSLAAIMEAVRGKSVLTVGETDRVPWAGGVVRFYLEDNKVRFEISPEAAKSANLDVSTKLLALARIFQR
jgi:hypothetical protein